MRKLTTCLWASLLGATMAVAPALTARAETLADALVSAYRHSNLLEQNRAVLRAADEDAASALSALRPTLDFIANAQNVANETTITGRFQLQGSWTLFDGGQRGLALQAARETVLATRDALVNIEQNVLQAAVSAFFAVRTSAAVVDLRQSNLRLIDQELRAARDRFEVGEVTRTDVALAESRLAAARSELAAAQGQLMVDREAYKSAVGRFPGQLRAPAHDPEIPSTLAAAKRVAVRTHPAIHEAQRSVTVAELGAEQASKAYGPTVRLTTTHTLANPGGTESFVGGVNLTQRLYSGGSRGAAHRKAMAQRDQARFALQQTVLQVEQQVGGAWATLQIATAQIRAAQEQIRAAQVAFDGTREEARLGARTTLDVLDAEQEFLDARANRIQAQNNRSEALYSLLSSMGLLTVDHLKLGIATYDPAAYYNAVKSAPARHSTQGNRLDRVLRSIGEK